jgi:hypothetical protein
MRRVLPLLCAGCMLMLGAATAPLPSATTLPELHTEPDPRETTATPRAEDSAREPADASATADELARLARLAQEDGARHAAESSVRNAPGRTDIEVGGLRRCVDATGASVFTDRQCDSLGASDAPLGPALPSAGPARITSVRSCARSKVDLLEGVRNALEVHDVNRLADYYHWTGMDGATGYRLMDRLEAFTRRPFVDAQLVSSATPRPIEPGDQDSVGLLTRPFDLPDTPSPLIPPPGRPRRVDLLRVDQMRSESDAAAQVTWFHLRANAGCWWITL